MSTKRKIDEMQQQLDELRKLVHLRLPDEDENNEDNSPVIPNAQSTPMGNTDNRREETHNQYRASYEATELANHIATQIATGLAQAIRQLSGDGIFGTPKPRCTFQGLDHEEPEEFLRRLTTHFAKYNINDPKDRVSIAAEQLRGEAKTWFAPYANLTSTFEQFKEKLRHRYDSIIVLGRGRAKVYSEVQGQDEPAEIFITRKINMFNRFDNAMPDIVRIDLITEPLKPEIAEKIRGITFTDVEHLIKAATQVEADMKRASQQRQNRPGPAYNPRDNQERQTQESRRNPVRPSTPCRFCQEWHFHNQCPRNPFKSGNGSRGRPEQPITRSDIPSTSSTTSRPPAQES